MKQQCNFPVLPFPNASSAYHAKDSFLHNISRWTESRENKSLNRRMLSKGKKKWNCDIPQNEAEDLLCRFRWTQRFPMPWVDDPPLRAQELLCLYPGLVFLCLCYAMHPDLSHEPLYRELKKESLAWQPKMFIRNIDRLKFTLYIFRQN